MNYINNYDYKRVWEIDLAKDAYLELQQYFRRFDPLHAREDDVFTKLGYIDVQHLCQRIRAQVFTAVTRDFRRICLDIM